MSISISEVSFTRSAVARMLFCTTLTIRNREKSGVYPEPTRGENNYRTYSLYDVMNLMGITHGQTYLKPIIVEFWNENFRDPKEVWSHIVAAQEEFLVAHPEYQAPEPSEEETPTNDEQL